MSTQNADQQVLGYLGRALSLELSAVQMYSTQAQLTAAWGLADAAKRFSNEAHEELGHAERIIGRMLALGVAPSASQLRPVKLGPDLQTLLNNNHAFEKELVKLYTRAVVHCSSVNDHDGRMFFEGLRNEELVHAEEMRIWLDELQGAGS